MTDGVHAAIDNSQTLLVDPSVDLAFRDSQCEELGTGDDSVLTVSKGPDLDVDRISSLPTTYAGVNCEAIGHAAEFAAANARWVLCG